MLEKNVSAAKLAANRANAQHSTGPRTPEGKQQVSGNARKHGFRGTRFFCPDELRTLLDEIDAAYRASIQPQGLLEEDAFLQLRNHRFNMERAQILMAELAERSGASQVDPLADPALSRQYLLYHRYFLQAQSAFHRYLNLLRQLQTERALRERQPQAASGLPALARQSPLHKLARQQERLLQQQAKQRSREMEQRSLDILAGFLQRPAPGAFQSKPHLAANPDLRP